LQLPHSLMVTGGGLTPPAPACLPWTALTTMAERHRSGVVVVAHPRSAYALWLEEF